MQDAYRYIYIYIAVAEWQRGLFRERALFLDRMVLFLVTPDQARGMPGGGVKQPRRLAAQAPGLRVA